MVTMVMGNISLLALDYCETNHTYLACTACVRASLSRAHSHPFDSATYVFSIAFQPRPHLLPAAGVNPYAAHIYYNRGNLYKALGRYEEAEEDYRQGEY